MFFIYRAVCLIDYSNFAFTGLEKAGNYSRVDKLRGKQNNRGGKRNKKKPPALQMTLFKMYYVPS